MLFLMGALTMTGNHCSAKHSSSCTLGASWPEALCFIGNSGLKTYVLDNESHFEGRKGKEQNRKKELI